MINSALSSLNFLSYFLKNVTTYNTVILNRELVLRCYFGNFIIQQSRFSRILYAQLLLA